MSDIKTRNYFIEPFATFTGQLGFKVSHTPKIILEVKWTNFGSGLCSEIQ